MASHLLESRGLFDRLQLDVGQLLDAGTIRLDHLTVCEMFKWEVCK